MNAIVFKGPYSVELADVPDPTIEGPLDAVVRITTTNICGSDLHMYEGRTSVEGGKVLGHENMGVVEEVGAGVERIKVGDRVSVPFNVDCGVEAVGYQAHDPSGEEHPEMVLDNLVEVVRATGGIGVVGVYVPEDDGAENDLAKKGRIAFDWGKLFTKGQRVGTGQTPVKRYNRGLRDLILAGKARPSFIVSHELGLEEGPDAYRHFDKREDGWTKVLLHPGS